MCECEAPEQERGNYHASKFKGLSWASTLTTYGIWQLALLHVGWIRHMSHSYITRGRYPYIFPFPLVSPCTYRKPRTRHLVIHFATDKWVWLDRVSDVSCPQCTSTSFTYIGAASYTYGSRPLFSGVACGSHEHLRLMRRPKRLRNDSYASGSNVQRRAAARGNIRPYIPSAAATGQYHLLNFF